MHLRASLTKFWAYSSMLLVTGIILFLFGYVFYRGAGTISWEFLSQPPRGAVLGEEGGIWPAIVGSLCFTAPLYWEESLLSPQHSLWCFTAKDAGQRD